MKSKWRLEASASRLEAIASTSRLEAIASGLEAIASRLEAIAIRLETAVMSARHQAALRGVCLREKPLAERLQLAAERRLRHLFVDMIGCEPVDGAITPEDHEDCQRDNNGNSQGLQVKTSDDQTHCKAKECQPLAKRRRGDVDSDPTTDRVTKENKNVGDPRLERQYVDMGPCNIA